MESSIALLEKKGRVQLAKVLKKCGHMPLSEYSQSLYAYQPLCPLEPVLLNAFETKLQQIETTERDLLLQDLQQHRTIQTSTHLTASEGPSFFAIHWLSTLGLPENRPYWVSTFSGVPFSNSAWSGCLNYSDRHALNDLLAEESPLFRELKRAEKDRGRDTHERRISLFPGKMRDALVYRTAISERMADLLPYLCDPLKTLLPQFEEGPFSQWALQFCQNQMRSLFPDKQMVYLDLNEVISRYLIQVLEDPTHVITRSLFDPQMRNSLLVAFENDLPLFMLPTVGKRERFASLTLRMVQDDTLPESMDWSPHVLIQKIQTERWCPGLFLMFTILSFLNGFKCLGSYGQVEYLEEFRQGWLQVDLLDEDVVRQVPSDGLTSGRFIDQNNDPLFPLDVIMGTHWHIPETVDLYHLMTPLLARF